MRHVRNCTPTRSRDPAVGRRRGGIERRPARELLLSGSRQQPRRSCGQQGAQEGRGRLASAVDDVCNCLRGGGPDVQGSESRAAARERHEEVDEEVDAASHGEGRGCTAGRLRALRSAHL